MNILGAIFPLGNFSHEKNSISQHLQSALPFARTCLIRGDADQCFRSLLFQAALSYAAIEKTVCYYTPTPFPTIPVLIHQLKPNSLSTANLHLIQFHYLSTLADVQKHLMNSSSDIIIIDGYLEYPLLKNEDLFRITSACVLLRDMQNYRTKKFEKEDLILLCSCTCTQSATANIEHRALFDLGINVEMRDDGDYQAKLRTSIKKQMTCTLTFRMCRNEILPLRATIEY